MIRFYPVFFYFQLVAVRTAHGAKTEAVAARMAAASAGLAILAAPAPSTPTPSPRRDRLPLPGRARSTKFSSFRNIWKTTHSRYLQSRYLQKKSEQRKYVVVFFSEFVVDTLHSHGISKVSKKVKLSISDSY